MSGLEGTYRHEETQLSDALGTPSPGKQLQHQKASRQNYRLGNIPNNLWRICTGRVLKLLRTQIPSSRVEVSQEPCDKLFIRESALALGPLGHL